MDKIKNLEERVGKIEARNSEESASLSVNNEALSKKDDEILEYKIQVNEANTKVRSLQEEADELNKKLVRSKENYEKTNKLGIGEYRSFNLLEFSLRNAFGDNFYNNKEYIWNYLEKLGLEREYIEKAYEIP